MPQTPDDVMDPAAVQAVNAQASVLMKEGIALMESGDPAAVLTALDRFDRAREMRSGLPLDSDPVLRFGLAACWLNRADALVRLRDGAQLAAALESYDAGIEVLATLPMADDARYPRRLAIAHQNRGLALQSRDGAGAAPSIEAFGTALAILEQDEAAAIPDRDYLAAAILVNLGSAHVAAATAEGATEARAAALRALPLVSAAEADDPAAADVSLRARHVLCQALAIGLSALEGGTAIPEEVHEATDLVDEGLALVRQWEQRGITRYRDLAFDLFRFGARLYGWFQPQFLLEFVRDNLDPAASSTDYVESPPMQFAAREALDLLRPTDQPQG